jgi:hypothetical protein
MWEMTFRLLPLLALIAASLVVSPRPAESDSGTNELARKVANPVASLISIPVQYNFDDGIGPFDTGRSTANLQPVVPISLGPDARVRLISRTIVPFIRADGGPFLADVSGVGDVTQSVFVTNAQPTTAGWTFGVGPVLQFPTGSEAVLTTDHWCAGPTAIAVRQMGPWTYGALVNHLWSFAGNADRAAVRTTFMQPFVNYVAPTHTTLALNTEASRDWTADTWSVPIHLIANQLLRIGPQPMSVFVGVRYWADSPAQGPDGFGWRAGTTLLFPTSQPQRPGRQP